GVGDRFDGDAVVFRAFQPANISRKIEISNLPTSFSKHLAGANSAADDLVYVVGGIIFTNDLAFAGIRSDDADTPRRTEHYTEPSSSRPTHWKSRRPLAGKPLDQLADDGRT